MSEIIHIEALDPSINESAGIKTYILNIFSRVKNKSLKLIGIKINTKEKKYKSFDFISLLDIKNKTYLSSIIPISISFLLRLQIYRIKTNLDNKNIHTHRIDSTIPFCFLKGKYNLVVTMHGITSEYLPQQFSGIKQIIVKKIYEFLEWIVIRKSNKIIFVSKYAMEYYKIRHQKYFEKFYWIPPGISTKNFDIINKVESMRKVKFSTKKKNFLFVGRLEKIKGVDILLNVFKELPEYCLYIIGNGREEKHYQNYVKKNKMKNVFFIKPVQNDKLIYYYNACDALCMASLFEGTPIVMLEALSCGVPVISTKVGDARYIINKKNGVIVERNVSDYKKAIKLVLNAKYEREKIREDTLQFDIDNIVKKIVKLYD